MSIETFMILAFLVAVGLSLWKLYLFMPTKPLPDDDANEASREELTQLMLDVIDREHRHETPLSEQELLNYIVAHEAFDETHYWRFNRNKLNQLLRRYYLRYPHTGSIPAIYEHIQQKKETKDAQK